MVSIAMQFDGRRYALVRGYFLSFNDNNRLILPYESYSCCHYLQFYQLLKERTPERDRRILEGIRVS